MSESLPQFKSKEPVQVPNRTALLHEAEETAQLFLRSFDARRYSTYYRRIYAPIEYLDQVGIDTICELLEHGNGLLNVAEALDLSGTTLRRWIALLPSRQQQVLLAGKFAGNAFAFKAEKVLLSARGGGKQDVAIASKLAEHYRWMASRLDKENFGEPKATDPVAKQPMVVNLNFGGDTPAELKTVGPPALNVQKILELAPIELPEEAV